MMRVMMVCTGNTCRSPMAAALLQEKIRQAGAECLVTVASAGVMAAPGEPMSAQAQAVLMQKGLSGQEHRAALLTRADFASYDLILTMTTQHKRLLLSAPEAKAERIFTLCEYAGENGDISDPYGGDESIYTACALELEGLLDKAWEKIKILAGKKQVLAKKTNDCWQKEGMDLKIAIGSDHGGFRLKEEIKDYLRQQGVEHTDFGTYSTASVDYPDIAQTVGEKVAAGEFERGILICGTGIGISIAANKVPGVRAALCGDVFSARMSREHNNANILALGERVTGSGLALMIVQTWLETEFAGGRHARRVEKISALEK